jgi:hypothetical protein
MVSSSCLVPRARLLKQIDPQVVTEGETLELLLASYILSGNAEDLNFQVLEGVGEIKGSYYLYAPGYDEAGEYWVKLQASNGSDSDFRRFKVTVIDNNRAPSIEISDLRISVGEEMTIDLSELSTDPDGDSLTYELVGQFGQIIGTELFFDAREMQVGVYQVEVRASDGKGGQGSCTFLVTVFDSNQPPEIVIPDFTIKENETLYLDLLDYAFDPDGDEITFALITGVGVIEGIQYVFAANYESSGTYDVEIAVSDSEGASSSGSFEITVIDVNRPPSIPFDPVPKMAETIVPTNTSLSWSCGDLDGDSLLYDVYLGKTPNPVLVASGVSGETYTPVHLEEGTHYYWKVVASDGEDETEGPIWEFTTVVPPVILGIVSDKELIVSSKVSIDGQDLNIPLDYVVERDQTLVVEIDELQEFDYRKPVGDDVRVSFIEWDDGETSPNREILMDHSLKLTARFLVTYYLNIATSARYEHEIPGEGWHDEGATVVVTAPKIEGYTFRDWDLNETYGIVCGEVIVVKMAGPVNLVANYTHDCP